VHPWVPITTREGFDAQFARVARILSALPAAAEIYLSDLQGAPSACGCGHPMCRWATDYFLRDERRERKIASGTPLAPDAAADFVDSVRTLARGASVIPVWLAECAEGDERCHGVPCFEGACWPALAAQWGPVVARNPRLAVFVPSRSIGLAPPTPAEVRHAVAALAHVERVDGEPIAVDLTRIVPVIESGTDLPGAIVAWHALDQSWTPRVWRSP